MVYSVLLRLVVRVVLHLAPVHVQHLAVALLDGLQHRALLLGIGVLVQHLEQVVTGRVHLPIDSTKLRPTGSLFSSMNLSQRCVLNARPLGVVEAA